MFIRRLFILFILIFPLSAFAANTHLGIDLYLYNNLAGMPEQGTVTVRLCDSVSGGTCYCSSPSQDIEDGLLSTSLACSSTDIANLPQTTYVQVSVDGQLIASPEVNGVPYALIASQCGEAATASGLAPGDITITGNLNVTGTVTGGSISGSTGDITSVVAGTGLSGGGISGDVTLTSVLGTSIESTEITDGTIATADLADGSITTAKIADNGVTLGTKTTGDYVGTITAGTGILTTGANSGEGIAHTLSVDTGTTASKIVQLDGTARLPAVDGSQLTNIAPSNNSVTTGSIVDGTITTNDMANDTIDFNNISDNMTLDADTTLTANGNDLVIGLNSGLVDSFQIISQTGLGQVFTMVVAPNAISFTSDTGQQLLSLSDTAFSANLSDAQYSQRLCHNGADAATGFTNIGDCGGGQADLAEFYGSKGELEAGDVVSVGGPGFQYEIKGKGFFSKAYVEKSNKDYNSRALGVISTNPFSEVLGEGIFKPEEVPVPLALAGRVPVKVTSKNGAIQVGDFLTSSNEPGYAMKAIHSGPILGIALEDLREEHGKILMFIKNGWQEIEVSKICESQTKNVTLEKGKVEVFIDFDSPYPSPPSLQITPLSNPEGGYWIAQTTISGFRLKAEKVSIQDRRYAWTIFCN